MAAKKHSENPENSARTSRTTTGPHEEALRPIRVSKSEHAKQVRQASIEAQKELFSRVARRGSWESQYTPLTEILNNTNIVRRLPMPEARRVVREVYDAADSKGFKISQELFSDREDVLVPGDVREISKTSTPYITPKADSPVMYSQLGLLFTRVSISFATKTGILPEKKRSARELVEAAADLKVVTQAKYLMECVEPLGNRAPSRANAVVLCIGKPTTKTTERYQPAFAELGVQAPLQGVGSILYTRHAIPTSKDQEFPPRRTAQVFSTAYEAVRKTYHEETQYEAERTATSDLINAWGQFAGIELRRWIPEKELNRRLSECSTERQETKVRSECQANNDEIVSAYRGLLARSSSLLTGALHLEKQEVADRILSMKMRLAHSPTGRINPGPILAQTEANYHRLQMRLDDINIKSSYNRNDQQLLITVIEANFAVLDSMHQSLLRNATLLNGKEAVFSQQSPRHDQYERDKNMVFSKLHLARPDLKGIDKRLARIKVRPFTTFRDAIEECGREFERNLKPGGLPKAKECLANMFIVTRAFKANCALEFVRVALTQPSKNLAEVFNKARTALVELQDRSSLFAQKGEVDRGEYATKFNAQLDELKSCLESMAQSHLTLATNEIRRNGGLPLTEAREDLITQGREALDKFDFEKLIHNLRQPE